MYNQHNRYTCTYPCRHVQIHVHVHVHVHVHYHYCHTQLPCTLTQHETEKGSLQNKHNNIY